MPSCRLPWLSKTFGVDAHAVRDLGLRDAEDREIVDAARARRETVIASKDSDFVDLVLRLGVPPQVLWVTSGNLTNRRLQALFLALLALVPPLLRWSGTAGALRRGRTRAQ